VVGNPRNTIGVGVELLLGVGWQSLVSEAWLVIGAAERTLVARFRARAFPALPALVSGLSCWSA
jgi:hypothetical protein